METTERFLDIAVITTNVIYIAVFVTALWKEYRKPTLRRLTEATRRYWLAAALAVLGFALQLLSVPFDGFSFLVVPAITVVSSACCAVLVEKKRARKAEMERF